MSYDLAVLGSSGNVYRAVSTALGSASAAALVVSTLHAANSLSAGSSLLKAGAAGVAAQAPWKATAAIASVMGLSFVLGAF